MGMQRGAVACPPSWKPRVKPTLSHRITTEGWGLEPSESPPTAGPPPPRLQVRVWDCTWTSSTGRAGSGCRCATEEMRAPGLRFVTSISFNLLHVQWWSVSCCLRDCQPWHLCLSAERLVVSQNRCGLVETGAATTVFCFCFFLKKLLWLWQLLLTFRMSLSLPQERFVKDACKLVFYLCFLYIFRDKILDRQKAYWSRNWFLLTTVC